MSRFLSPRGIFGVLSLVVLGIGFPNAAMAVPQDPFDPVADELVRIYVDEMTNCDCDYLVVAVLQGALSSEKSKKGYVVNLFPPGNDGTRKNNDPIPGIDIIVEKDTEDNPRPSPPSDGVGGAGAGESKSGAKDHNTTRSNRGGIRDTGGGTGSGDSTPGAVNYSSSRSNRGSRTDTGGGTGSGDAKSGAVNHNSSRSNKGTTTDTGGDTDIGDADVRECEHCGASCTERCRCKPTGMDLIFGHTDDRLLAMESDADGAFLAFETCYGMRSVTLTSMGKDLNLTLVIAKGWRAESRGR